MSAPLKSTDEIIIEHSGLEHQETDGLINHKPSILSEEVISEEKFQPVNLNAAGDENFYRKNKKAIWIAGGILLGAMAITGIVLAIVLGGHGDNPTPPVPPIPPTPVPPEPVDPDPFEY